MTQHQRQSPAMSPDFYDAELSAHNGRLRSAARIGPGDRVLDVGCGAGQSTRDAARVAAPGEVLGIDISASMLERARELTAAAGLDNVAYECGDAQVHPFIPRSFDLVISRFGSMFFADPDAAFTNIAHAMRPAARLVLLVWQARDRNPWTSAISTALTVDGRAPAPARLDAFSLGDPAVTTDLLGRAGFADVELEDVREPVFYGPDVATALHNVRAFCDDALSAMGPEDEARAIDQLRETLTAHHDDAAGVTFDSRSWIVTATRDGVA